ncbi:MAG: cell division protein FtsK, partial [Acidimicrobiales bacterium]|nr:cell division protein FtsK [Acidimicrobiales bacterium]
DDDGVDPVELEPLEPNAAHALARVLSPVVDAGALVEDHSDLPASVAFLALAGPDLADNPAEIVEHWRGNHSIPEPDAPRLKRDNTLRALVGQTATDRCYLDLRADGPHALVGGTTGAGKSEFLQTWILGLAAAHSPARVNFLLVDYKGGTAFADCVELPHCVGLVTDLTPHLVRRALTSLRAELRRREGILNSSRAKDLLELERLRDPSAPPSLVIVVDEFAALVSEVPEFVDGVVDIAQRGRSLGLHLVLATQRPAGVIKGSLRANTNLRIALRVADPEDSTDIVGTPVATDFDPSAPGRAVARTGPGRLTHFQTAYLGGRTTNIAPPPSIEIAELPFSVGAPWEDPEPGPAAPGEHGPADIRRLVDGIRAAHAQVALPAARRPWLPELSPVYRLEDLPSERTDRLLAFGVVDRPAQQDQAVVAFYPDRDGNMAVYGTGGSGKSTFLRSIAVAAGLAPARGGPCHVYAIDCGARGLAMLEGLPHVGAVLNGDDGERVLRLLKQLRATIDERSARYAAASAATIVEYRQRSGAAHEPRILLLIDNFGSFRQTYEIGRQGSALDLLESIAAEGRAVGVHLLATADQVNAFTTSLRSVIQSRLALRLSSDVDLLALGVPTDVFGASTPAGRGFLDGDEVQVAVLGGDSNLARQAAAMARFAAAVARQPVPAAPPIARLQERITSAEVSQRPGDRPVLGIWDETLEPLTFEPAGAFIVAGPPGSGRSSTVASMLHSLELVGGRSRVVRFGPRRSPLAALDHVEHVCDVDESSRVAAELTQALRERNPTVHGLVAVIENVSDFANGPAADALQQLIRAARTEGAFVIIEGETPAFNGNYGLIGAAKLDRTGIVLQPDQNDGDYVLGTSFPRVQRRDFPPGRGLHVRAGRVYRVQVLAPVPA